MDLTIAQSGLEIKEIHFGEQLFYVSGQCSEHLFELVFDVFLQIEGKFQESISGKTGSLIVCCFEKLPEDVYGFFGSLLGSLGALLGGLVF